MIFLFKSNAPSGNPVQHPTNYKIAHVRIEKLPKVGLCIFPYVSHLDVGWVHVDALSQCTREISNASKIMTICMIFLFKCNAPSRNPVQLATNYKIADVRIEKLPKAGLCIFP